MPYLYELTNDYLRVQEYITYMLEQDDLTDEDIQALQDTLESINDSLEDKVEGILKVRKHIEYDIEAYKAEEKRLEKRRKALEKSVERLTENVKNTLLLTGIDKLKAGVFTVSIRNNAATAQIIDESKLPKEYLVEQAPKVDKRALTVALKAGEVIEGAVLGEPTKSLIIK